MRTMRIIAGLALGIVLTLFNVATFNTTDWKFNMVAVLIGVVISYFFIKED